MVAAVRATRRPPLSAPRQPEVIPRVRPREREAGLDGARNPTGTRVLGVSWANSPCKPHISPTINSIASSETLRLVHDAGQRGLVDMTAYADLEDRYLWCNFIL